MFRLLSCAKPQIVASLVLLTNKLIFHRLSASRREKFSLFDAKDQVVYREHMEHECIEGICVAVTNECQCFLLAAETYSHSSDLIVHLML